MPWVVIALCLFTQAEGLSALRIYPIDDSARDAEFRSFVKKLRSVVETRNTSALRKLVDNDVVVGSSDEAKGWVQFRARWRPDDADSELWPVLADLLALGFVREHPALFLSPYLVWRFPRELNRATHLVVIRDKAELREAPSLKAPSRARVSFEVVEQIGEPGTGEGLGQWVLVRTADGETGYLNTRDALSPMMPRAQFGKRHGKWSLIALESESR